MRSAEALQAGQALIEGLLISLLFVPVLTGAWMLASLHDLQSQIISATRLVAIQRASIPTGSSARSHLNVTNVLFDPSSERARLWRDPLLDQPWLRTVSDVRVDVMPQSLPISIDRPTRAALVSVRSTQWLSGRIIDLVPPDYARVDVAATLDVGQHWAITAPITLREQLVVLENGWSSDSRDDVELRVFAISATNRIRSIEALIRPIRPLLRPIEPSIDTWCPGWLDVEIIPPDRLSGHATPPTPRVRSRSRC